MLALWFGLALAGPVAACGKQPAPHATKAFRVPYTLTETKHLMVRGRVNGRGPLHLVVDTGAPALFLSPAAAGEAGLSADEDGWAGVERLELEGGVVLEQLSARLEEPPQLGAMNRTGLAGHRLDGILGYTVLSRFRIEIDVRSPRMLWTPSGYEPLPLQAILQPPPARAADGSFRMSRPDALRQLQGMAEFAGSLMPAAGPPTRRPRGYLGIEFAGSGLPRVARVEPGSPAAGAGLRKGDLLIRAGRPGRPSAAVRTVGSVRDAAADLAPGESLRLTVRRGRSTRTVAVRAAAERF